MSSGIPMSVGVPVSQPVIGSLHANGAQAVTVGVGQLPLPSQLAAAVAWPLAQLAPRQAPVEYVQLAELPLQVPMQGAAEPLQAARPIGAPVTITQLPMLPARLHE